MGARIHTKADADLWALVLGQSVELHNDINRAGISWFQKKIRGVWVFIHTLIGKLQGDTGRIKDGMGS